MTTEITPEIFEAEAMQHIDDLYRTALRLTRDSTDADDLADLHRAGDSILLSGQVHSLSRGAPSRTDHE